MRECDRVTAGEKGKAEEGDKGPQRVIILSLSPGMSIDLRERKRGVVKEREEREKH